MDRKKILAVDDNTVNTTIIKELLGDDYDVETADDGISALAKAGTFWPDIILLDIMMPGMDGYEVCRKIRENDNLKYTKIIFLSAKSMLEDRLLGYEVGADDYITKPFDNSELLAKVRVYLRLKAAEELDAMKSDLTITVTHELRTPLTIMKNIISNINAGVFGQANPKLQQQLNEINMNINRQAKIISNFLDTSKIDAGKMDIEYTSFNVKEVIEKTVKNLSHLTDDRDISIETNIEDIEIEADESKFVQVLTDLFENAVKYMDKPSGKVTINAARENENIYIEVSDTGSGIEPEHLNKIFDKFVQVKRNIGPGEHGTGLGLAIVKGIVELHGGRVWAKSKPGEGSTFCFVLPLSKTYAKIEQSVQQCQL